jgi:hypothetical protein
MVASREDLKRHILALLETLPEESLADVAAFLDFQLFKLAKQPAYPAPYRPVPLGGLWRGTKINDDEIADIRREMWTRFPTAEL